MKIEEFNELKRDDRVIVSGDSSEHGITIGSECVVTGSPLKHESFGTIVQIVCHGEKKLRFIKNPDDLELVVEEELPIFEQHPDFDGDEFVKDIPQTTEHKPEPEKVSVDYSFGLLETSIWIFIFVVQSIKNLFRK